MKKVCFFGIYDPNYSRNRVLRAGFTANGYEIMDCRIDPKINRGGFKYWKLYQEYKKLDLAHNLPDLVVVAFPGHSVVWLARLLFGRNFIFDAFVSLYDSNVLDRRLYSVFDPRAWKDFSLDWLAVSLAPIVLLDTEAQIKYFQQTFNLSAEKALRVFVGTDDRYFYPDQKLTPLPTNPFIVHFHGSYIPLQGIEYIIAAAAKLVSEQEIIFRLIGKGQERRKVEALAVTLKLSNIVFIDYVDYDKLSGYLNSAHICLGIFGKTAKATRVIPNKVFEALACGRPLITMDSPAIHELLTDGQEVILCPAEDGLALAEAIMALKINSAKREELGHKARILYEEKLTPVKLVSRLLEEVRNKS